ncbi:MAG: phosphate signaling complex protein PhoU [Verrucomicrobiae bacterium]|nr:phosphate signaling complex protein PhoU [Verrucomicrobiae bacterium]
MLPADPEFAALKDKLLTMSSLAMAATRKALKALIERDDDLAREVDYEDRQIDALEKALDELCITLLSRAPLASDLRMITVALKITHDLERVGDEAASIARRAVKLNTEPQLKEYIDLPRMAAMALDMLKGSLDAFVDRNGVMAHAIIPKDQQVDALHGQIQRELSSYMVENPANITRALHLIEISKRIERIADHATNIAEETVFLLEGRDVRQTKASISQD